MADHDLTAQFAFLAEADKLKAVERANMLIDLSRQENSAEHSWHLTLYAMVLAGQAPAGVNIDRVIRMLILHDLVEIDVGDVPLHSENGQAHGSTEIQLAEAAAARRLFGLLPAAQAAAFLALWEEFEASESPDAIFAKSLDRTQPAIQNIASGAPGWRKYNVTFDDLEARAGTRIARGLPAVWEWLRPRVLAFFG